MINKKYNCVTQNNFETNKQGYILVFTMIFIAAIIMLSMIISSKGIMHAGASKTFLSKEKAKMLAFSGLQIAMAKIAVKEKKDGDKGDGQKSGDKTGAAGQDKSGSSGSSSASSGSMKLWTDGEAKEFIKTVWPTMYQWQEIKLTRDKFGIEGVIKYCICAEEGKLDINQAYDFEAKKFFGQGEKGQDYKVLYQNIFKKFVGFVKGKDPFAKFESYFKKQQFEKILKSRQNELYDTTEFFSMDSFFDGNQATEMVDKIFYEPQEQYTQGGRIIKTVQSIYWTDIFTVHSRIKKISPYFISPSIKKLLGFKENAIKAENVAKNYKENLSYPNDWKTIFEPIFGIKYDAIPAWFKFVIDTKFEPRIFSVLAQGTVDGVSHRIFAIIERKKVKVKNTVNTEFEIKKFYVV